ncbi:MAG: ABC transporter substrate-binding protein [Candidatus Hodarchaeota archaeon]
MKNWKVFILVTMLVFTTTTIQFSWLDVTIPSAKSSITFPTPANAIPDTPPSTLRILSLNYPYFRSFDPIVSSDALLSLIYDSLVDIDPDTGEVLPALARQWVVTNDSKHWTFYLRENIFFHDGTPFDAYAVEHFFILLMNTSESGPNYDTLFVDSVEVLDEFIVRINLSQPFSTFIYRIPFIPHPLYNKVLQLPSYNVSYQYLPFGTGPYILDQLDFSNPNQLVYLFNRNPSHFRGFPPFETIELILYSDYSDFVTAMYANQGDITRFYVDPEGFNDSHWQISPRGGLIELCWINQDCEELRNVNVRLALNYAINKSAYTRIIYNNTEFTPYTGLQIILDSQPATTVMSINSRYYKQFVESNGTTLGYSYDPQLAEELLDEAGYERGGDGYRFDLVLKAAPYRSERTEFISSYLDAVGIRCNISLPDSWLQDFHEGNYDLFDAAIEEGDATFYDLLHSSGVLNIGNFTSDLLDDYTLLEQQSPVPQEREYYYNKIIGISQELSPYLLLLDAQKGSLMVKEIAHLVNFTTDRFIFNYTTSGFPNIRFSVHNHFSDVDKEFYVRSMDNIEFCNQSIYFPFTDTILYSKQKLLVTIQLSNNLQSFIPDTDLTGIFFKIVVDNASVEYYARCYYDSEDLSSSPIASQRWEEGVIVAADSNLQFVEIKARGDIIIYLMQTEGGIITVFTRPLLPVITYRFVPSIVIISSLMIIFLSLILIKNQKQANMLRKLND